MRKFPIPLVIAALFAAAVVIYIVASVNTQAPPVWTSTSNTTLVFVTPQTYTWYGTEFNKVVDGKNPSTVISILGSRSLSVAVNSTSDVPWFYVVQSKFSYSTSSWTVPGVLMLAYNDSQLYSRYGSSFNVNINGTTIQMDVNPTNYPGLVVLCIYVSSTNDYQQYEYQYVGKVVMPNGFTWYVYVWNWPAGLPLKIGSASSALCSTGGYAKGIITSYSVSNYNIQITEGNTAGATYTFTATQVANVTASTTAVSVPVGSASSIYGPDGTVIGVAEPLNALIFNVQNGPVQITINP